MEKKKLKINCGLCDVTNVTEEHLEPYEKVQINCGTVLATQETQALLLNRGASLNCGGVTIVPAGVEPMVKMGGYTITPDAVPTRPTALIVIGGLTVEPGSREAVDAYASIQVTGYLTCPRSLAEKIHVTGSEMLYPDGAELMRSPFIVDRVAAARAKGKYLYAETIAATDSRVDLGALAQSGTKLGGRRLIVAESLLDAAVPMLEGQIDIVTVPDGTAYVENAGTLTRALVKKYGGRLYVDGDLFVDRDGGELLAGLEALTVSGTLTLPLELEETYYAIDGQCDELVLYRGKLIQGEGAVMIDAALLEREGFVTVTSAGRVELSPELTRSQILECLEIRGCGEVVCSAEQLSAAQQVSEGVGDVHVKEENPPEAPEEPKDPNVVRINCGTYKF